MAFNTSDALKKSKEYPYFSKSFQVYNNIQWRSSRFLRYQNRTDSMMVEVSNFERKWRHCLNQNQMPPVSLMSIVPHTDGQNHIPLFMACMILNKNNSFYFCTKQEDILHTTVIVIFHLGVNFRIYQFYGWGVGGGIALGLIWLFDQRRN